MRTLVSSNCFFYQVIWKEGRKQERRQDKLIEPLYLQHCISNFKNMCCSLCTYTATKFKLSKDIIIFLSSSVPPIVSLMLGSTLNPDDIKEGDDVYFECHVKANPPWRKLSWLHNVSSDLSICKFRGCDGRIRMKVFWVLPPELNSNKPDNGVSEFLRNVIDSVRTQNAFIRDVTIVSL